MQFLALATLSASRNGAAGEILARVEGGGISVGSTVAGRYRVVEPLGVGGMASVFVAEDDVLGRRVALKVLHPHLAADDDFAVRFEREATAAASLNHPNVVQVFDRGGSGDGQPWIVMELVDGPTLKQVVTREGRLEPDRAGRLVLQAARGVASAHAVGIVHRDLKPHNILVDAEDRARVADFGIARASTHYTLTQVGSILGTPEYLSPEQARGERATPASDVYALGVVLYELLAGAPPFQGDTAVVIAARHVDESPPRLDGVRPGLPAALVQGVERALSKRPAERWRDCGEFADAIESWRDGAPAAPVAGVASRDLEPTVTVTPRAPDVAALRSAGIRRWRRLSSRSRLAVVALPLVALALLLVVAARADNVDAPRITGRSRAAYRSALEQSQLHVGTVERRHDAARAGTVLEQQPTAGEPLEHGDAIDVVVSLGPRRVDVPGVIGLGVAAATVQLRDSGLRIGATTPVPDPGEPGRIVGQDPDAGSAVADGTAVDLQVAVAAPRDDGEGADPDGDGDDAEGDAEGRGRAGGKGGKGGKRDD